jgi:uncharacterized protein
MSFTNPQTQTLVRRLDWSLSRTGFGQIVQGANDISECILNCISNQKGSDPFRPDFGSDIWSWISAPITVAGPNMILAITQSVGRWEPRVKLQTVTYTYQEQYETPGVPAGYIFKIGWQLVGGGVTGQTELLLGLTDAVQEGIDNIIPADIVIKILATELDGLFITEDGLSIIEI